MSLPPKTAQYVRGYINGLLDEIYRLRAELANALQVATNLQGELNVVNDHLDDVIARAEAAEAELTDRLGELRINRLVTSRMEARLAAVLAERDDALNRLAHQEHGYARAVKAEQALAAARRDAWDEGVRSACWPNESLTAARLKLNPYTQQADAAESKAEGTE